MMPRCLKTEIMHTIFVDLAKGAVLKVKWKGNRDVIICTIQYTKASWLQQVLTDNTRKRNQDVLLRAFVSLFRITILKIDVNKGKEIYQPL